jgi:hypothetical protein
VSRKIAAALLLVLALGLMTAGAAGEGANAAGEAKPVTAAKPDAAAAKEASPSPGRAVVEPFPAVPIRYSATVMLMGSPGSGIVRLRMTVERWTTNEDRKKMIEALKSGGTPGLVSVMEKMNAGYLQVENNLRWPIRTAAIWKDGETYRIRIATNRPIYWGEVHESTRSLDYPFGIIELALPPEGKGEGALNAATQAGFDDQGRIEVKSLPTNTGPQRVTNVVVEKM